MRITPLLLAFLLAALSTQGTLAASAPAPALTAEDQAKLQKVLSAAGIGESEIAQARAEMTDADAETAMREAFRLTYEKRDRDYDEALELLKKVVAYDPYFVYREPDDRIVTHALPELLNLYYLMGDWEVALPAMELLDVILRQWHPYGEFGTPNSIAKCREHLAQMGKLRRGPLVVAGNRTVMTHSVVVGGAVLASLSEIAPSMGVRVEHSAGRGEITLVSEDSSKPRMLLQVGRKKARIGERQIVLRAAPRQQGSVIFVPVRPVADAFGVSVKWDPLPKIAWVR